MPRKKVNSSSNPIVPIRRPNGLRFYHLNLFMAGFMFGFMVWNLFYQDYLFALRDFVAMLMNGGWFLYMVNRCD